ncbi:MAG: pitrilysin family protein [Patescibacteria group bacterium]
MFLKTVLKNKARLIALPLPQAKTAALLVMIGAGSRYENKANNGVSHFVEHLMFKGTKKRPQTLLLAKELDGVGAEYNAFTGKDYTGYYIKADGRHLSLAIEILSDMLLNSLFDHSEIEREKQVIMEEINMYQDNPLLYVEELVEGLVFSGNPLGYSVAGTKEIIKKITPSRITDYYHQLYCGQNMVIALAGCFSQRHLKEIEKKINFSAAKVAKKFLPFNSGQKQSRLKVYFKETEQVQLALAFPAYSYFHRSIYALQLLSVILGGNMSSRLFLQVRERQGLAYFVRAWPNFYQDTGSLIIQAGLDKIRIEQALRLILTELKKIKKDIKAEELNRAKEYLAGKILLELEDPLPLAQWFGQQELMTGKLLAPEEKIAKFRQVSLEQIKKTAKEIIDFKKINLAVIGPFKQDKNFKSIINSF